MLSTEWLKAFAPVGTLHGDGLWAAGACVFFHKPPLLWVVTARHVLETVGPHALTVVVSRSSGEGVIVVEVGRILAAHEFSWVQDEGNDLAAAPIPASTEFGLKALTLDNCMPLAEVVPSMPCFTVGCPYGLPGVSPQTAIPLVLDGVISGVDSVRRRIYTSAPTFAGNSGGPLIAFRSPFTSEGGIDIRPAHVFLVGIMLETRLLSAPDLTSPFLPYRHYASGSLVSGAIAAGVLGTPSSSVGIPALHLGVAAPADAVLALLDSEQARTLTARIEALPRA
jgi:hypothetical protein